MCLGPGLDMPDGMDDATGAGWDPSPSHPAYGRGPSPSAVLPRLAARRNGPLRAMGSANSQGQGINHGFIAES